MQKVRWFLHRNHKRVLENKEFDRDDYNEGWTPFWNFKEKKSLNKCRNCVSTLIEKVENYSDEAIDLSVLKDCYKVIFTVSKEFPINYIAKEIFLPYCEVHIDSEFHGKLGGYGEGRHLLFFGNSLEDMTEKKEQLQNLKKFNGLEGVIYHQRACGFMYEYLTVDDSLKSKVTNPELFLQRLKRLKKVQDKALAFRKK